MSEIERHPLVENVAKALADAAKEEGYSWYFDEMDGERFLGCDDLPDEDLDVGGEHWVKGRNYYREMARVSLATLHLDKVDMNQWATRISVEVELTMFLDGEEWKIATRPERKITWHRDLGGFPELSWRAE